VTPFPPKVPSNQSASFRAVTVRYEGGVNPSGDAPQSALMPDMLVLLLLEIITDEK